jgi:drug/metabolite transporter (DMT)-like permease
LSSSCVTPARSVATCRSHSLRGYLLIAAAGLCWGISATVGRAVFTGRLLSGTVHPISPLILAQSRTTISFLVLMPVMLMRRGAGAFGMAWRDFGLCLALGVMGMAGSNYFYYLAIQRTNVATAITLQYTAPILVLLYMLIRGRQRATLRRVGSVLLAVLGIALTIGILGRGRFHLDTLGLLAAEIAAVSFAYYNIAGSQLLQRYDRWRILLVALLGAALFWQCVNPLWKISALSYSGAEWGFLTLFAVTSILVPFSLYFGGLQYLDATRAIVTSCLEPVFSIAIAATVLAERLGFLQVTGIAVVLAATIAVQLPEGARDGRPVLLEPID